MNLLTSKVKVFPSAYRTTDADGKFTSEQNLTGILRAITGRDSFYRVVDASHILIVIHGYCFTVEATEQSLSETPYAHIRVDANGRLADFATGGTALDSGGNFTGLVFDNSATTANSSYTLQITAANKCYMNANELYGTLAVANGGTGVTNLNDLPVSYVNVSGALVPVANALTATGEAKVLSASGKIGSNNVSSIFDGTKAIDAKNVSNSIGGVALTSIFESGNTKVKNATTADKLGSSSVGDTNRLVYISSGVAAAGIKIFCLSSLPTNPQAGDIWIKTQ